MCGGVEQRRIDTEVSRAQHQLALTSEHLRAARRLIAAVLEVASRLHESYVGAAPETRQRLNQAVFAAIHVEDQAVTSYDYEWPFGFMPKGHSVSSNKEL